MATSQPKKAAPGLRPPNLSRRASWAITGSVRPSTVRSSTTVSPSRTGVVRVLVLERPNM